MPSQVEPRDNRCKFQYVSNYATTACGVSVRVRFGRSRSSKIINFGTNRKRVCDFLLDRHSNLVHILHRFRDIAGFCAHDPNHISSQSQRHTPLSHTQSTSFTFLNLFRSSANNKNFNNVVAEPIIVSVMFPLLGTRSFIIEVMVIINASYAVRSASSATAGLLVNYLLILLSHKSYSVS